MVNMQYLSVYLVHNYVVNRPLSIKNLTDRIVTQKIVYLADILGVNCGDYVFSWYKKGPYSPALTKLVYAHEDEEKDEYELFHLSKAVEEQLEPLKEIVSDRPSDLSEDDWIELVASVHYLYDHNLQLSYKELVEKLISYKPKYFAKQVFLAIDKLEETDFIN